MTTLATNPWSGILALEDDRDDTDLLRILLRKAGFPDALEVYREGEAVITALTKVVQNSLKAVRPLLCFLDIKVPPLSGHDVLRWIRGQPQLDQLPVVMLSGSEHPRDIQQAAQHGAQCYLTKYPQPGLLKQVVLEAERFSQGSAAEECFCFPANLLLVRCRRLTPRPPAMLPRPTAFATEPAKRFR
jgi:chemotaxis family two-component system response regulator Rcp1